MFTVPFTDSKTLLENGQLMDVTAEVEELGYTDKFNPIILAEVQDADGNIYGFPRQAYAMGLHYNRALFEAAGLDPDSPPTTWDEVREAAKAISDATGKAGYAQMTMNNTGGWQLTAGTVAHGGRIQEDGKSTINNPGTVADLRVPPRPALGGQLDGQQLPARLGFDQPGVRGRQHRHVHLRFRRLHRPGARLRARPRRATASRSSRPTAMTRACSAVATSR